MPDTDRRRAQEEGETLASLRRELSALRTENAALQLKVQSRDDFIATAGHDMRNHMNALQIHAGLIQRIANDGGVSPLLTTKIEAMRRATFDFVRRSTAMLDVARLASGTLRLDLESVDFGLLVREVLGDWAPVAELARCKIALASEDAVYGTWDRMAIEQVVTNLISNAIKYGPGKAIDVRVEQRGASARLEVRDSGIGISDADRERIFAPFERAVTRRQNGGFGLGLWISQHIVVAHRGSLQAKSEPGRGSTFVVTLPCTNNETA